MATISTSGISALQVIKSEHLLRIINALNGVVSNDIIIGGSLSNGTNVTANGISHAEGANTVATGNNSHAEGFDTKALGNYSHAEGNYTTASNTATHAEGFNTNALSNYSHAEGSSTKTIGASAHAEGNTTQTGTQKAFLAFNFNEGLINLPTTFGNVTSSFSIGDTIIYDDNDFDGNVGTLQDTIAAVGYTGLQTYIVLSGTYTDEYYYTAILANLSRNPKYWGGNQYYSGDSAHAEGNTTIAYGINSHAEGFSTVAQGGGSHAEGDSTLAKGAYSHAEGYITTASADYSHAEGSATKALGAYSHAEGYYTIASGDYQHVQGQFNISSSAPAAFIHGNGTSTSNRSNLIFASGSEVQITGSLKIKDILQLSVRTTTPTPVEGMIIASGSAGASKVYYYNGTTWNALF
jgi:hypothetical protein